MNARASIFAAPGGSFLTVFQVSGGLELEGLRHVLKYSDSGRRRTYAIARRMYSANEQVGNEVTKRMQSSDVQRHVGEVIRRRREQLSMSLRTLAEKVDFSPSFISQVENGQVSPSISSLERICLALGLTLSKLFEAADTREAGLVMRTADRRSLTSEWSRASIESLIVSGSSLWFEPLMIALDPQGTSGKKLHSKPEEEFAIVFEGQIILNLDGKEYRMERGDSVVIPSNTPHRWANESSEPASIVLVTRASGRPLGSA
jgi:transcriptional regulator with XRE-family HTH domain